MDSANGQPARELGQLRFSHIEDAFAIQRLIDKDSNKNVFHKPDIHMLIEKSFMSICQLDVADEVVGYLALQTYPNIPSVHPSAWEEYIWTHYRCINMRAHNTLFVHMFCWDPQFSTSIVKKMLKSVFAYNAYIYNVVIVMPPSCKTIQEDYNMDIVFLKSMEFMRHVKPTDLQYLYVAERATVNPRLQVRKAVEEDNDELVEIIDKQSTRLKELYGEFYISELIGKYPESNRLLLVAEVSGIAVGLMCLNTTINYNLLNDSYHLEPYFGLHKQTNFAAEECDAKPPSQSSARKSKTDRAQTNVVNFHSHSSSSNDLEVFTSNDSLEYLGLQEDEKIYNEFWDNVLIEDESLEFDIVNIDCKLLEVATCLSYERIALFKWIPEVSNRKFSILQPNFDHVSEEIGFPQTDSATNRERQPNAFIIEIFAMHEDYDERCGYDILEVAFELFPNLDYCIIALPTSHVVYPLLEHFTHVTPRVCHCQCISEALYVAHRNSVSGKISVRPGELGDLKMTYQLLSNISASKSEVLADIYMSLVKEPFVLESEGELVGLAVVTPAVSSIYKRTRYNLKKYYNIKFQEPGAGFQVGQGNLFIMVMSPVLQPHANFFLREIFRFTCLNGLYWICEAINSTESPLGNNLMSVIGEMIRVLPHPKIEYSEEIVKKEKVLQEVVKHLPPFAMWYSNPRLTSLPKLQVNHSIVVIGASRTAMAFLKGLVFGSSSNYLNFTNITLISNQGLPRVDDCLIAANWMLPHKDRYDDSDIKSVPFNFFVNIIEGFMIDINRQQKYVELLNGTIQYYDQLFLMCGIQFQHPDYMKALLKNNLEAENQQTNAYTTMDNPNYKDVNIQTTLFHPENLFVVNSIVDANNSLITLRKLINVKVNYNVIVYGSTIHAYCCLYSLLEMGIPPSCIVFVEPFPYTTQDDPSVTFFNNEYVDQVVNQNIEDLGIRVYRKFNLAQDEGKWCTYFQSKLKTVKFISNNRLMELQCIGFFYYGTVGVNINTFIALNKSGIIYDGGVVINNQFETNDSNIFAAGTITKYKRIFHSDSYSHIYYQSKEIGLLLGEITRIKLDPLMANQDEPYKKRTKFLSEQKWHENSLKIPTFRSPIIVQTKFPGGLNYLNVSAPGQEIPLEVFIPQERYGPVYTTNKSGYFRLQFDCKNKVCSITCLSREPIDTSNIRCLYGRHEQLLNNFMIRYATNTIDDLYVYFSQPWMYALYHADFEYFLDNIQNVIIAPTINKILWYLVGLVSTVSSDTCTLRFEELGYREQIMAILITWLSDHQETLPVYAMNEFVQILSSEVCHSIKRS